MAVRTAELAVAAPRRTPEPVAASATARPLRALGVATVLVPFIVAAVRIWSHRNRAFLPFADHALLEMQLRDLPSHLPLTGAYSRFGWYHPGPLATYLIGIIYWLTGRASVSMWLGGLAINAAACVAMVCVAFRRLGAAGGVVGTAIIAWYLVFLGPLGISDPWNPVIGVLPFVAALFCLWDAWCGGRWIWLGAVAFGSISAQAHLQYALPIALLGLGTLAALAIRHRATRREWRARCQPVATAAVGLLFLLSLPLLIEQFTARSGNLTALWSYATTGRAQAHPLRESVGMAVREVVAPISSVGPGRWINTVYQWPGPARLSAGFALVALAVATVSAGRRRAVNELGLLALGAAGWVMAALQFTRVERELWPYLCLWASALFVPLGLFVANVAWVEVRRAIARRDGLAQGRIIARVGALALVLVAVVSGLVIAVRPWAPARATRTVGPLAERAAAQLPRNGPVVITDGGLPVMLYLMSLDGALQRRGVDVRAPNELHLHFGDRVIGADRPVLTLQLYVIDGQRPAPIIPGRTLYSAAGGFALYELHDAEAGR